MKTVFKTLILIAFLSVIVIYSKPIQTELTDSYNKGIAFLSNHTIAETNIIGF